MAEFISVVVTVKAGVSILEINKFRGLKTNFLIQHRKYVDFRHNSMNEDNMRHWRKTNSVLRPALWKWMKAWKMSYKIIKLPTPLIQMLHYTRPFQLANCLHWWLDIHKLVRINLKTILTKWHSIRYLYKH